MLSSSDRANFDTLCSAFSYGDIALLEVQRRSDSEILAAVCAVGRESGNYVFTPFAILVQGDPYEQFNPPHPDGGFIEVAS